MALYDLQAIERGVRVADLLGKVGRTEIPVNALIGSDALESALVAVRGGFTCLKLKIDGHDIRKSCAVLRELRHAVGEAMKIRIDVNRGWSVDEAIECIPRLAASGIEYIEQPVASIAELARVRSAVGVPIAADECVTGEAAVRGIAAAAAADVIVVKPALVGLQSAMAIAGAATECGLAVVVTSALETSIGIAAALHLAATLPDPVRHCGLATAPLLAGDLVGEPLVPMRGFLRLPDAPGLGVHGDDSIERWRVDASEEVAVL
jgi:O-succinylbenzoate synthase